MLRSRARVNAAQPGVLLFPRIASVMLAVAVAVRDVDAADTTVPAFARSRMR
jgi:hypothetical protein